MEVQTSMNTMKIIIEASQKTGNRIAYDPAKSKGLYITIQIYLHIQVLSQNQENGISLAVPKKIKG